VNAEETPSAEATALFERLREQAPDGPPSVEALRAGMTLAATSFPLAEDVLWEAVAEPGARGEWVATAPSDPASVLLYVHGGLFVAGSPATHRELVARLARASRMLAFVVDYRLAPEHPFPAPLEDVFAAYRWLLGRGVDPRRIAIAGDDAGAALLATTVAALRDAGDPLPSALVALSPWFDLERRSASRRTRRALDPVLRADLLESAAELHLGGADPAGPLASPAAIDYRGFPPMLVQVGTAEMLHDDAVALADRARAAGVAVELEAWTGMVHAWHLYAAMLPEGRRAISRVGAFLRESTNAS
jgi:epsilon-lactone hydrolase